MVKIIFYGTPEFAVPSLTQLLRSKFNVLAVVTQPDRPKGRGKKVSNSPIKQLAQAHQLPVMQPERVHFRDGSFAAQLQLLAPELAVVAAYGHIIPEAILQIPSFGTINVHASLLPKYRGAAPIHRSIIAGESETGITIMRLVQEMDAGPMLSQTSHRISPTDTSVDVEHALASLGATLLATTVAELASGSISETAQQHDQATYAPKIQRTDGVIDWSTAAHDIHNLVRGLHPWPHAFTQSEGKRYLIHRTTLTPEAEITERPGTIVRAHGHELMVSAGRNDALLIESLQAEGGKVLNTRDFLAGQRWTAGKRFD